MGFPQQERLWKQITDAKGTAPTVVDADNILADPEGVLRRLCAAIGLDWDSAMLSWPPGPRPEDGAWAPHWYDAVWRSTGFGAPPGPLPELSGEAAAIAQAALPGYERLLAAHV
jgi:hypothetical protein